MIEKAQEEEAQGIITPQLEISEEEKRQMSD
jgi:hypothetical protein